MNQKVVLRPYQKECLDRIKEYFRDHDRQIIQLPTGAGKTVVFLSYIASIPGKTLIICPTVDLVDQVKETAEKFSNATIFAKGLRQKWKKADITISTSAVLNYDSSKEFLNTQKFDTIIFDEAHRAQCSTYLNFLEMLDYPFKLLGCTATPERLDRKPLLDVFGELTYTKNILELIRGGYLCDMEAHKIKTGIKLDNLKIRSGEFIPTELKKLETPARNKIIIDTYKENCQDKKTLVFCLSIDHSENIASMLREEGIKAEAIHGKLGAIQRRLIIKRFKSGQTKVLTNCQLLTEGFDEPSIEAILIARPTKSKALYCQMIGRGLRTYPRKELCYLYELGDNSHNICSFNVAAGKEADFVFEYKKGTRLTELSEELDKLTLDDVDVVKEKINLFEGDRDYPARGNQMNIFKTKFYTHQPTEYQKQKLKELNIDDRFVDTFLEAAFLIWKHYARIKYGIN